MKHLLTRLCAIFTRFAFLAVLPLAAMGGLSSCTVHHVPVTPEVARSRGPGEGFIVASFEVHGITRSGEKVPGSEAVKVLIKGEGAARGEQAMLVPRVMPTRKDSLMMRHSSPSELLAIPVPAGQYEITGWQVTDMAPTATVSYFNRLPMKVPFEVKAGEATYIGRVNSLSIYGKNIIGMKVPGEALVLISDRYEKDVSRISKYYPSIPRSSIRRSDVPAHYKREIKRVAETPEKFLGLF